MVRCFIGAMIPRELKGSIELVNEELKKLPIKCKFVERKNLHICLSFLGEIEENKLKNISEELESICNGSPPFEVIIDGIKMIPSEKYIRVLALDVIDRTGSLKRLIKDLQKRIGGSAKPPHLTLCRVKNISNKQSTIQKIRSIKIEDLILTISKIQIIKSELKKSGPIYTTVFEAILK